MSVLLLAHAGATLALVGLIWTIQLVHYPMFAGLAPADFGRWHERHAFRIGLLVGPLMALEAATAVWLCLAVPPGVPVGLPWLGLALVFVHVASTAFLQVPCHRRLARGFDAATIGRLVRTNWIRTAAWSIRGGLVLALLASVS